MANTFCLLDFLSLLVEDKEAKFYPKHPNFIYQKITKSNKIKEGYDKFIADDDVVIPIANMTWHKDRFNLSILCKITGTVAGQPTFQYRNYTIIRNAVLNVEQFPFSCSESTIMKLKECGIKVHDGINIIYLNSLPLINQDLVNSRLSAQTLADKAIEALKLEAKMKVFNNKFPKVVTNDTPYCPPTESVHEEHDYYLAKTFKLKIKGGASIPKVETVENKLKDKKRLNFVEEFMKEALDECYKGEEIHKITKQQLKEIRRYISETKFIIFVSGQWFEEFDSFDDCVFKNVTFELGEEKVKIDY